MQKKFRFIPSFPETLLKWKAAKNMNVELYKNITPSIFLTSADEELLQESIEELTQDIVASGVIPSTGTRSCVNIRLRRKRDFAEEFRRLYLTLKSSAGFHNDFYGIVAVDLTEWSSDPADEDLDAVLSFLKDSENGRFYVFYAATEYPAKLKSSLALFFSLETHNLSLEKTTEQLKYVTSILHTEYGIPVDSSAEISLMQIVKDTSSGDTYRGVVSLNSLCRDISYHLMTKGLTTLDNKFLSDYKKEIKVKESKDEKPVVGLIK